MSIAAAVTAIAVMRRKIALYGGLSVLYERLLFFFCVCEVLDEIVLDIKMDECYDARLCREMNA